MNDVQCTFTDEHGRVVLTCAPVDASACETCASPDVGVCIYDACPACGAWTTWARTSGADVPGTCDACGALITPVVVACASCPVRDECDVAGRRVMDDADTGARVPVSLCGRGVADVVPIDQHGGT